MIYLQIRAGVKNNLMKSGDQTVADHRVLQIEKDTCVSESKLIFTRSADQIATTFKELNPPLPVWLRSTLSRGDKFHQLDQGIFIRCIGIIIECFERFIAEFFSF